MQRIHPILLAMAVLLGLALAQTPAGTNIQNQASASYIDSAGQPRTTTSNQVITVVQHVYNLTITPDGSQTSPPGPGQTQSGLPGSQVLFSYQVTNTGNGTDIINLSTIQGTDGTDDNFDLNNVEIFLDGNCNGNIDAGENTAITSVTLAMGASACVIVRGTIPSNAGSGDYGNLNLTGTSQGNSNVTDTGNWARATATTAAVLTASKSASPSGNVNVPPGGTITYTISGSNTGGSAAGGVNVTGLTGTGILISDIIPTGLTVTSIDTVNSTAGTGTVSFVYTTDGTNWSIVNDPNNVNITGDGTTAIGMFIVGTGAFFPVGAQYTFSFQATVPTNAAGGTPYPNTATVSYNDGTADQTTTSNEITNTAANRYSVAIGGNGTNAQDGPDTQTIATATSGSTVTFHSTLQNTGNAPDSFTLSLGTSSIGTCTILQSDGVTPLSAAVPLAAGATYDVVVKCTIPASQNNGGSVTLTATSVNNPNGNVATSLDGVDETTLAVTNVIPGYTVDAAHNTNGTAGESLSDPDNDTTSSNPAVNPGDVAYFPFEVSNTGANPDTYNLTATLPAGWTAVFYPDTDCDGNMDTSTPAPVTDTGPVNPGATNAKCFIAAVQVPANAAPVDVTPGTDDNVQFTVTSTTLPTVSDTIKGAVDVNPVAQISLTPNRSGTVTSPGTIQYTHTLTNNSNASANCNLSGSGGSYSSWTYQYSLDGNTWASSLSGVSVPANGGTQTIYVRVITPAGVPIGSTDVKTLTASCTVAGSGNNQPPDTDTDTATENTTIVGGELSLTKSGVSYVGSSSTVRDGTAAEAKPGDEIEYTVVAQNIGTGDLKKVIIIDPLPSYTSFVSVSASASGFSGNVLYSTNGTNWSGTAPAGSNALSAGQSIYVGVDTNGDGNITDDDVMPPGAKITLTFRVKVQ